MAEEKEKPAENLRRLAPRVDIYETPDSVVLLADMPGVTKEDLQLDINEDELAIRGAFEEQNSDGEKLIAERVYGEYYRSFTLGDTINREKIIAKLDNGVLTLTLPKQEKVKPRKISIETE